jgi:hypothetical protein
VTYSPVRAAPLTVDTQDLQHPQLGEPSTAYPYQRSSGDIAFVVCRFEPKDFRPAQHKNGRWVWNLNNAPILPYRLPEVEDALGKGDTIWIVDGEKDADALAREGVVATCCARSQGWTLELAEQLTGARRIKIIADRDTNGTGLTQALQVREMLIAAGAVASCDTEILQAAEGKDAYDHLAAGENLNSFLFLEDPELLVANGDVPTPIVFETLRSFLKRDVPQSESLVGVARDGTNLLPRYGWVMPWGKEGSGKTSILVDLVFHACTGIDWLEYAVGRPLKVVAVVNEGVPGGLQDKLRQKTERWEHSDDVLDNLAVYASPWGEFTFANERMVAHAQDFARDFGADYIALDPLHTLGTTGVGSPVETEAFKHILRNFGLWDWIGIITAHHSNKGGMLSGDWGRHPDTVIHVEKDGKAPATKFTIHKARPADPAELGVPCLLEWITESLGYRRVELAQATPIDEEAVLNIVLDRLTKSDKPLALGPVLEGIDGGTEAKRTVVFKAIASRVIHNLAPPKKTGGRQTYRLVVNNAKEAEALFGANDPDAPPTLMVDTENKASEQQAVPGVDTSNPEDEQLAPNASLPIREAAVVSANYRGDDDIPF